MLMIVAWPYGRRGDRELDHGGTAERVHLEEVLTRRRDSSSSWRRPDPVIDRDLVLALGRPEPVPVVRLPPRLARSLSPRAFWIANTTPARSRSRTSTDGT